MPSIEGAESIVLNVQQKQISVINTSIIYLGTARMET
jgi:hypothetical protein